ncbi:MAG: hypothetical protein QOH34_2334 [Mycobacterium sp.]|nr:hypothetical protein [Mycobacterium sp.]
MSTLNWCQSAARRGEPSSPQRCFTRVSSGPGAETNCWRTMPCCARSVIRSLVTGAISFGGNVGQSTTAGDGIRAYIGRAAELWAADGFGFFAVINALFHEGRYAAEAFDDKNNLLRAQQHGLLRGRTAVVFGASAIPAPVYRPALADPNLLCSDGKSQGSGCSTYRSH